ncbi:M3 family metallopeptidase [Roseivivax marinus]|uniref:M3 family metallopeptidase n=1 Tax=Roseivivax marinus TaxID=1379903 RepID=UPI0009DCB9F1|nr:M3 family metallopeptidase [Roseivivax marinus]
MANLLEGFVETRNVSASGFREILDAIDQRITLLSHESALSTHEFVELTALYNNAAYILLYLDANSAHIEVDFLEHYREALGARRPRNDRLIALIKKVEVDSRELEVSKDAFLEFFEQKAGIEEKREADAVAELRRRGAVWRENLDREKSSFLARLGVNVGSSRPDAALYALLSGIESSDVRRRLGAAWRDICERHNDELCSLIDRLVAVRKESAAAQGDVSITERTLRYSQLDVATVRNFLDCSLQIARAEHEELENDLNERYGPGGVRAHFASRVALVRAKEAPTSVALEPCIKFALKIAHDHFGLDSCHVASAPEHMITYDIMRCGKRIGRINFDLWGEHLGRLTNTTQGLRNRTNWTDIIQEPVAHISCRFKKRPGQEPTINFQNAHSLLHEFGHALNHLLVTPRLPNLSGLEYLPLERLEILSMWFERWVFHPAFESALSVGSNKPVDLEKAREIKRLEYVRTHLERNVLAMLDFELHQGTAPISEVYAGIDQRYDIAELCPLSDVLPCFFWPILMERPSGYFCYLWAAASSAERFEKISKRSEKLEDTNVAWELEFRDCFEFDAPSEMPNIAALYRFYEKPNTNINPKDSL